MNLYQAGKQTLTCPINQLGPNQSFNRPTGQPRNQSTDLDINVVTFPMSKAEVNLETLEREWVLVVVVKTLEPRPPQRGLTHPLGGRFLVNGSSALEAAAQTTNRQHIQRPPVAASTGGSKLPSPDGVRPHLSLSAAPSLVKSTQYYQRTSLPRRNINKT